eukprot:Ihof_evm4s134 gene=Ihof_evmTU4s134
MRSLFSVLARAMHQEGKPSLKNLSGIFHMHSERKDVDQYSQLSLNSMNGFVINNNLTMSERYYCSFEQWWNYMTADLHQWVRENGRKHFSGEEVINWMEEYLIDYPNINLQDVTERYDAHNFIENLFVSKL